MRPNHIKPIEYAESLCIGVVEFVSPDEIKVSLNIEAPESLSLNTGTPIPFPRINGYVLIPNEEGYLVGQIEWLAIEKSPYPKRRGTQKDFELVDLPYPLRKMSLNPVGILKRQFNEEQGQEIFKFNRGVNSFPSVGDNVLLPTQGQLHAIIESGQDRRVKIGVSPLADNAEVFVNPDRLFGRHLAVLGNTGSGKSCSVAGLIRWSLDAAQQSTADNKNPNARFIVLDPNGEYSRAFQKDGEGNNIQAQFFKIEPHEKNEKKLQLPLWFWNSAEWCAFAQASKKTQRPLLRRALREVKSGRVNLLENTEEEEKLKLRRYISSILIQLRNDCDNGTIRKEETKFGYRLQAMEKDLQVRSESFPDYSANINSIINAIETVISKSKKNFEKNGESIEYFRAFSEESIRQIINELDRLLQELGGIIYQEGASEDMPIPFDGSDFADHLEILSEQENVRQYLDFLIMRIRTMLSDTHMKSIMLTDANLTLEGWLKNYIGNDQEDVNVTIIDLSLVPSEVIHIITAVIARMIFEALQRYRKINKKTLPTVIVMEEAHTFIKRYRADTENQDATSVCRHVFEKIAREGRKFGLGLVISSQRPSELSPTVLSQCNTFLLHRISNDEDQKLVRHFIPDNLKGLLRELPSLPSQNAILMGWASELPVLVKINDLPEKQQPLSDDPDFWDVWTGKEERNVDWKAIVGDWQEESKSPKQKP